MEEKPSGRDGTIGTDRDPIWGKNNPDFLRLLCPKIISVSRCFPPQRRHEQSLGKAGQLLRNQVDALPTHRHVATCPAVAVVKGEFTVPAVALIVSAVMSRVVENPARLPS